MSGFILRQDGVSLRDVMDGVVREPEKMPPRGAMGWVVLDQGEELPEGETEWGNFGQEVSEEKKKKYSPGEAVALIESGESIKEVLANLDVAACHFIKRVADQGRKSLITTGASSSTGPSSGVLVFSDDEMKRRRKAGENPILVVDPKLIEERDNASEDFFEQADGLVILSYTSDDVEDGRYDHFLVNSLSYPSVLLDNQTNPKISMVEEKGCRGIKLGNGKILYEGQSVTLDPMTGRLWDEELPIIHPDENAQKLVEYLDPPSDYFTQVAVHVPQKADINRVHLLADSLNEEMKIGLRRTDVDCARRLRRGGREAFRDLSKGVVPSCLKDLDDYGFASGVPTTYRLPDIHNMRNLLPPEFQEALKNKDDHKPGTELFKMRETLYKHQLRTVIRKTGNCAFDDTMDVIIPSVINAKEVKYFKEELFDKVKSEEIKCLKDGIGAASLEEKERLDALADRIEENIKFGVMMEIPKALIDTLAIAPFCDCLCFGMNGLTEHLTGLSRGIWDHSGYMKDKGFDGVSPYNTLIPPVLTLMLQSLAAVWTVEHMQNRKIRTNTCGRQVAGHDIKSILTVLRMGFDQITVPARLENFLRAMLTVASQDARRRMEHDPHISFKCRPLICSDPGLS